MRVELELNDAVLEPMHEDFGEQQEASEGALTRWLDAAPEFESDSAALKAVYDKSIVDLAALRIEGTLADEPYVLPAAGLPWFMTLFGRDTLITSLQTLGPGSRAWRPPSARGAAGKRDRRVPRRRAGKILHEIRQGELTVLGEKPHSPYYGTADATPLWLILLSDYWRLTDDDEFVRDRGSASWPHSNGSTTSATATTTDTSSTQRARPRASAISAGRTPGTEFSSRTAAFRSSRLPRRRSRDTSTTRSCASQSCPAEHGRHYACRPARARGRRALHPVQQRLLVGRARWLLLRWSRRGQTGHRLPHIEPGPPTVVGDRPEERARTIASHLLSDDLFSGWGVHALAADLGYNPIGYHTGTIWPHDNAIVALGLARWSSARGEPDRARPDRGRYALELPPPEAFAGFDRVISGFPVPYPTACSPQAWATGAPFVFVKVMLGLEARDREIHLDPHVPDEIGRIQIRNMPAFGAHWDVEANGTRGFVRLAR